MFLTQKPGLIDLRPFSTAATTQAQPMNSYSSTTYPQTCHRLSAWHGYCYWMRRQTWQIHYINSV